MGKKLTANEQTEIMERLSQAPAAWLLGTTARSLRDLADCPRNPDGSYNGAELVKWDRRRVAPDTDPMLAGGSSPALEKYREHRAGIAELELNERRGRLVDIDAFNEWWESEVASPIRRSIETLQRKHGPDAAKIIEKALQRSENAVRKRRKHG